MSETRGWMIGVAGVTQAGVVVAGALTIAGFFGNAGLWFDQAAHFRAQYAAALAPAALILALMKRRASAWAAAGFFLINAACIAPLYVAPTRAGAATDRTIKILMINVHTANTEHQRVLKYIQSMDPDIVALEEINRRWASALKPLEAAYPHHLVSPQEDNFGMAFYSRIEADSRVRFFGDEATQSIEAKIPTAGGRAALVFTHPVPPISPQYFRLRNTQLEYLGRARRHMPDTLVLLGDLNMTSWSYYFRKLSRETGLVDSRRGFGVQTSWPSSPFWLRVPIDHVLVSPGIRVIDRRIGPDISSDHFPVYVELQM